ncbi:hypothetical protein [Allomuricauda sp. M10]|uniref:hypothetical protein n=1 Tax=Allomuricauda sp. M10 TaxID=2683292 RepID=UPI001D18423F|nr:hypothetical protein [Muricauda sp. M10]
MQVIHIHPSPIPWYLLMWREMCPHDNTVMYTIETAATCETVQCYCVDCDSPVAEITDCV